GGDVHRAGARRGARGKVRGGGKRTMSTSPQPPYNPYLPPRAQPEVSAVAPHARGVSVPGAFLKWLYSRAALGRVLLVVMLGALIAVGVPAEALRAIEVSAEGMLSLACTIVWAIYMFRWDSARKALALAKSQRATG